MSFDPGTPLGPRGRQVQTETTGLRDGLSYTKWFAKEKRAKVEKNRKLGYRFEDLFSSKKERWTTDYPRGSSGPPLCRQKDCSLMFEDNTILDKS